MKVAVCCLNSKYIHASLAPWCLVSSVNNTYPEIDISVVESTINRDNLYMINKIIEGNFDIVSFCTYIWNITKTLEIAKVIKEKTNATVILGGPEVSYRAEKVLNEYSFVDYIIIGEGEESFPKFLNNLKDKTDTYIDGLCYRQGGEIISTPEARCKNTPVSPYTEEFFNNLDGRISYIETSRGCPFRCAFCLSGRCSPLRFFDLEQVKNDIIKLSNSGTKTIKFVDRTFNANAKRANEILSFILQKRSCGEIPENVCFHFEIAGDILKDETISILEKAPKGLFQLEIGLQSFNVLTLTAINRSTNIKDLKENIKKLISLGNMHIHIDLIVGLPLEDMTSFQMSFNNAYRLKANMLQMGFLKLLYGTEMRENSEKYACEYTKEPPYEVISTPYLSADEIKALKKCEDALDRLYNSGRFILTLNYLTDECGFNPFAVFFNFGNSIDGSKMSLSEYAEKIYNFFEAEVDNRELLREALICDLLSCSSALQIPDFLKIKDPLYKQIKKHFAEGTKDKIQIAVLYKSRRVFVVNQSKQKDFSGRYEGKYYPLENFE